MDKRSKVRLGLYFGIVMTLLFILQELLTHDNLTTKSIMITVISGLFWGALAGLLFGWLMGVFANSKFLTQGTKIDTDANETIVFETRASHFKGAKRTSGKLYLTNKRLVFKFHKSNTQNRELSISLSHINKVYRYKTLGITNNGLAVTTDNKIVKFAVQQPDQWINQLTEKHGLQYVHL
jgi:hypothetical protein